MAPRKLIHISDLHLSRTRAYTFANWLALLSHINYTQPDLVINSGDLVMESPEDTDDLAFAREQMARLTVPWRAVPGDHDIGGGPPAPRLRPEVPWLETYAITEARRAYYLSLFNEDCWAQPFGDWYLIGINDLMFESGFEGETVQWQFIEQHLELAGDRPTALFMHKPPCVTSMFEAEYITTAIPALARQRLRKLMQTANVRLIGAGHLHVYRTLQTMGATVVTAPTIMRGVDDYPSTNGLDVNGLVEYTFDGEGVEIRLVQPRHMEKPRFPITPRGQWPPLHACDVEAHWREQNGL